MAYGISLTKLVATGNDFILIDDMDGAFSARGLDAATIARDLCRRRFSVGADGLLVLESASDADFRMRIINPDGTEVDMCGNGARASAFFASSRGLGEELAISTGAGRVKASVSGSNVKLRMAEVRDIRLEQELDVAGRLLKVHCLNTGVPHVVLLVDDIEDHPVEEMGRAIRQHPLFSPQGTNVNFAGEITPRAARVRTYERGVEAETLACGTGSVAVAACLCLLGRAESPFRVRTNSGQDLTVHLQCEGRTLGEVYLEGHCEKVFEADI